MDNSARRRVGRQFTLTHLPKTDYVWAEEIQNVKAFGLTTELQTLEGMVQQRQQALRRDIELTWENLMLGAVQGIIYDSDGSTVIYNLFTEFSVTQESEVDFELDDATTTVRQKCDALTRTLLRNLKGGVSPGVRLIGLASDGFWDSLVNHSSVEQTFLN